MGYNIVEMMILMIHQAHHMQTKTCHIHASIMLVLSFIYVLEKRGEGSPLLPEAGSPDPPPAPWNKANWEGQKIFDSCGDK